MIYYVDLINGNNGTSPINYGTDPSTPRLNVLVNTITYNAGDEIRIKQNYNLTSLGSCTSSDQGYITVPDNSKFPYLVDTCDNITNWSASGGATITNDSTYYKYGSGRVGVKGTSGYIYKNVNIPITQDYKYVYYWFGTNTNVGNAGQNITFYDNDNCTGNIIAKTVVTSYTSMNKNIMQVCYGSLSGSLLNKTIKSIKIDNSSAASLYSYYNLIYFNMDKDFNLQSYITDGINYYNIRYFDKTNSRIYLDKGYTFNTESVYLKNDTKEMYYFNMPDTPVLYLMPTNLSGSTNATGINITGGWNSDYTNQTGYTLYDVNKLETAQTTTCFNTTQAIATYPNITYSYNKLIFSKLYNGMYTATLGTLSRNSNISIYFDDVKYLNCMNVQILNRYYVNSGFTNIQNVYKFKNSELRYNKDITILSNTHPFINCNIIDNNSIINNQLNTTEYDNSLFVNNNILLSGSFNVNISNSKITNNNSLCSLNSGTVNITNSIITGDNLYTSGLYNTKLTINQYNGNYWDNRTYTNYLTVLNQSDITHSDGYAPKISIINNTVDEYKHKICSIYLDSTVNNNVNFSVWLYRNSNTINSKLNINKYSINANSDYEVSYSGSINNWNQLTLNINNYNYTGFVDVFLLVSGNTGDYLVIDDVNLQ